MAVDNIARGMAAKALENQGGGDSLLYKTYTSDDIAIDDGTEKYIVDEEFLRAVLQSINNKTQMPRICVVRDQNAFFSTELRFGFGTGMDSEAFIFVAGSIIYYVFDTYDNAYKYYDR